jgi:dTDP-4-amino-4,6-dideoxygalactose transaminase
MAILSFHPAKHITTGEGGAICTNSLDLYERLLTLRSHGIGRDRNAWRYEQRELGFNYRLTDFQSALGLSQLKKLDFFVERRRKIAERYNQAFLSIALQVPGNTSSSYHLYVVKVPERERIYNELAKNGVGTQVHYIPLYKQPDFAQFDCPELSGAEEYYASCLSLPMYPAMTDSDVEYVIDTLQSILHR